MFVGVLLLREFTVLLALNCSRRLVYHILFGVAIVKADCITKYTVVVAENVCLQLGIDPQASDKPATPFGT